MGPADWSWGALERPRHDERQAADQTARPGTEEQSNILYVLLICPLKGPKVSPSCFVGRQSVSFSEPASAVEVTSSMSFPHVHSFNPLVI